MGEKIGLMDVLKGFANDTKKPIEIRSNDTSGDKKIYVCQVGWEIEEENFEQYIWLFYSRSKEALIEQRNLVSSFFSEASTCSAIFLDNASLDDMGAQILLLSDGGIQLGAIFWIEEEGKIEDAFFWIVGQNNELDEKEEDKIVSLIIGGVIAKAIKEEQKTKWVQGEEKRVEALIEVIENSRRGGE